MSGAGDLDDELGGWFAGQVLSDRAGRPLPVRDPYDAGTTPELYRRVAGEGRFLEAVGALRGHLADPTSERLAGFVERWLALAADSDLLEILFLVFRESLQESWQDKRYFLEKLKNYNKIGEALSDYRRELAALRRRLERRLAATARPRTARNLPVTVKTFDLENLDRHGEPRLLTAQRKRLSLSQLGDTIKQLEAQQEELRSRRRTVETQLQNFDQKLNQLFNMLVSVLKNSHEMAMAAGRNLL